MRYMNDYDIENASHAYQDHPVLGPATETLASLVEWTNTHSDGWAYWPKPCRAAARLMELIEGPDPRARYGDREDATAVAYRKALAPIKAFRTRQGADFEIVEI